MESIVYRNTTALRWPDGTRTDRGTAYDDVAQLCDIAREAQPLSPELFYPLVSASEMITWTHWLPTTIDLAPALTESPAQLIGMLRQLEAPPAVIEEFHWSWKMGLFDTYEVRTPIRQDLRDPLLLGKRGAQHYRVALWGESLRPLGEITALVQQSLALRTRAARRRLWLANGGAITGFAFGLWLSTFPAYKGDALGSAIVFALLGFFCMATLWLIRTPENCQQDFLDRYRC